MSSIYQEFPFTVDPDDLTAEQIAFLQAALPGWEPHEGNIELFLIRGTSQVGSELATLIQDVPPAIFRYFGPLVGVPADEAISASVGSTWTMRDAVGYVIPAGTQVSIPSAGEAARAFEVLDNVAVPAGATTTGDGEVVLVAVEPGAAGNDLGGSVLLLEPLDFVQSIALVATSSGGADAESDDEYQARLAGELTLLTPTPILPQDFALLAQTVSGVERAMAINAADVVIGQIDEIQTVEVTAVGGTFTLTFSGQTTAAIAYNATAAAVKAALEALSNIAPGDIAVTSSPVSGRSLAVQVEWIGPQAGINQAQLVGHGSGLVASRRNELQKISITGGAGTFTLTFAGQTTAALAWNATPAQIQTALEALSNINPGDVACTDPGISVGGTRSVIVEFLGQYAGVNVGQMTAAVTGGLVVTVTTDRQGSVTLGDDSNVVVTTVQDGETLVAGQERTVVVASVDAAGQPVTNAVKAAVVAYLESLRETNFIVLVTDASYTLIDVDFDAVAAAGYDATDVHDRALDALETYFSPANWGKPRTGDTHAWIYEPTVRFLEVSQVLNEVEGLDYLTSLTIAAHGNALTAADVALAGQAPLTSPGTIGGTVTAP